MLSNLIIQIAGMLSISNKMSYDGQTIYNTGFS